DLTHRARTTGTAEKFPFDGEPLFEQMFDSMVRILHRRQIHHVFLTGERGVGKTTLIAELARRACTGRIPSLADKRFVSVDARFIAPGESRQRLEAILAQVGDAADLIVCIDGFSSLLRAEGPATNKAVLLAALSRARCRLIALLIPREFEELVSDDSDFAEFFARVEAAEPDIDVALKLLAHFAAGLEGKYD